MPMKLNNETGGITIDDFESKQGDPMTVTIRPPRVGALKRIRVELRKIEAEERDYVVALNADEELPLREKQQRQRDWWEEHLAKFWSLVLIGDDTFRPLSSDPIPEPDGWPTYLLYVQTVTMVIAHWQSVPLGRGDQPIEMVSVADQVTVPSPAQ